MAQISLGAKLAAALITGGSLIGIAVTSDTISLPGPAPDLPAVEAPSTPVVEPSEAPTDLMPDAVEAAAEPVNEPSTEIETEADTAQEEPETVTAVLIPQAPVLSGPPKVEPQAAPEASEADVSVEADEIIVPGFDLLRVEPDGSVVIVGNAAPGSTVEAITGSRTLGSATAAGNGDFVIIFEEQLAPGDYNIVLRADGKQGTVATSVQTAIVSIPQQGSDGILALVEEPGAPSRLISTGQGTAQPLAEASQTAQAQEEQTPKADASVEAPEVETALQEPDEAPAPEVAPATPADVRIEAVEIDGKTVFVAGQAAPGSKLRVYANDLLLGETTANPDGSFLVQVNRDLAVGDYMVRADLLSENGADVVMRAAVPFVRQPGEKLAAVAVPQSVALPNAPPSIAAPQETHPADDPVSTNQSEPSAVESASADATAVETQVQQPLQAADSSVIIRRGDTLWQISRRVYGRGVKYTTIYNANTDQIRDPNRIWPGQIFAVPENADPDED